MEQIFIKQRDTDLPQRGYQAHRCCTLTAKEKSVGISLSLPLLTGKIFRRRLFAFAVLLISIGLTPGYAQSLPGAVKRTLANNDEFKSRSVNQWGVYEKTVRFRDIVSLKGVLSYFGFVGDASDGGAAIFLYDANRIDYDALIWGAYSDNNSSFTHANHWDQVVYQDGRWGLQEGWEKVLSTNKRQTRAYMVERTEGAQLYGTLWKAWRRHRLKIKVVVVTFGSTQISDCEYHVPGIYEDPTNGRVLTHTDFHSYNTNCESNAGLSSAEIHIDRVGISLQKDAGDKTYQEVWGPFGDKETSAVPSYTDMPQKPYRIELGDFQSGNSAGYAFHGATPVGPIYTSNSTDSDHTLNIQIKINNPNSERVYYKAWLDQSWSAFDCHSLLESDVIVNSYTEDEYIAISYDLPDDQQLGLADGASKLAFLRIAIEKNESPGLLDVIEEGEVEDFALEFQSSADYCNSETLEIPYDYAIYADKELSYCEYKSIRDRKEASYQRETESRLLNQGRHFKVGVKKGLPYALAKHTKNGYDNHLVAFYDQLINNSTANRIAFDETDNTGQLELVSGGNGATTRAAPHPDALGVRKLDPLAYPYYKNVTFVESVEDMKNPGNMQDLLLYADVYYPKPIPGRTMTNLEALPIALWMPGGGFMWNQGRSYVKTTKPAKWLASQGFIVVTPDYRQGFFAQRRLVLRSMIRAWMDMNTAVKWWKSSGYDQAYTNGLGLTLNDTDANGDANQPLWKADLSHIIGTGSSAGAVTALHNAYLSEEIMVQDAQPGKTLEGITNDYAFKSFENTNYLINAALTYFNGGAIQLTTPSSFFPYDVRNYESIPCITYKVGGQTFNSCDGFINDKPKVISTATVTALQERAGDLPNWAYYSKYLTDHYRNGIVAPHLQDYDLPPTDPVPSELRNKLVSFHAQSGKCDKILSFAGAVADKGWIERAINVPPIAELHHENDGAVPADEDYSFSRISADNPSANTAIVGFYFINGMAKMHGGVSINRVLGYDEAKLGVNHHNADNFRLLLQGGPEKGGGGPGDVWQHQTQFTFGGPSYAEYEARLNPYRQHDKGTYDLQGREGTNIHQLEKKTMYFASAFMARPYTSESLPRVTELNYLDDPVLHLEDNTNDLAPLLGSSTNTGRSGYTPTTTTKASGLASFHMASGGSRITLDENNRFIHDAFTERTVSFWVKPTQSTGIQDLYDEGGTAQGFGVRLNNRVVEIAVRNGGVQADLIGSNTLPIQSWTHVTAVFELGRLKLYLNGNQDTNATEDAVMFTQVGNHGNAAGFGATEGNSNAFGQVNNNFIGWLDNLKIYNTTPEEVTTNMIQPPNGLTEITPQKKKAEIRIYPNPTNGVVNLYFELQEPGAVNIRIMNLAGQQVHQQFFGQLAQGQHNFELNDLDLPTSTYILEVTGPTDRWVKKLVVQKE